MKIENKIDDPFGIAGIIAGYVLIVFGILLILLKLWAVGLITFVSGALLAFTSTGAIIDTKKQQIKYYDKLFGIYKKGIWEDLKKFSHIKVEKINEEQKAYYRANNFFNYKYKKYEIIIYDKNEKIKTIVMKYKFKETADLKAKELSKQINKPFVQ